VKARLPYIQRFPDRHGKMRYYFRRGKARAALPSPADGWPEFLAAYEQARKGLPSTPRETGTIAALIAEYVGSADYLALKPNSRDTYRNALEFLRERDSAKAPIAAVKRKHVLMLRDELAEATPGKANLVLKVLRILFQFAIDREYIETNPTLKVKAVKGGSYRSWTDAELLAFESRWARGTTPRLIYELALATGQRRGDVAKMTWADIEAGVVAVVQEKTGNKVWVPLHWSLAREIELRQRTHLVVATTDGGRPFTPTYLGSFFAEAIAAASLADDCVLHGLRKAAARRLAEAGASDAEIMSVTGHTSREMVTLYTRDADNKRLAKAAILKLPGQKGND